MLPLSKTQMPPTRLKNQFEVLFSLLSTPWGIVAFAIIMIIVFAIVSYVLGMVANVFSWMGVISAAVLFSMVWLLWSALDDFHRAQWGWYLWALPFGALTLGWIGKSTHIIASLEMTVTQMNVPIRLSSSLSILPGAIEIGAVPLLFFIVVGLPVIGIAILFRDELVK